MVELRHLLPDDVLGSRAGRRVVPQPKTAIGGGGPCAEPINLGMISSTRDRSGTEKKVCRVTLPVVRQQKRSRAEASAAAAAATRLLELLEHLIIFFLGPRFLSWY
jgi:hypothetical protein